MWPLAVNGYSATSVMTALHYPSRTWKFKYELINQYGVIKKLLTTIINCKVTQAYTSTIQRTMQLTMADDSDVDFGSDRIRPWACLLMPDGGFAELPVGTFILSTPPQKITDNIVTREISGYDFTQILQDTELPIRTSFGSPHTVTDNIKTILQLAGITSYNLSTNPSPLPVLREWEAGTKAIQVVNDLAAAINYEPVWFDAMGTCQIQPYISLDRRTSEHDYINDALSVMLPDPARSFDYFNVPNDFVLVVSEPDRSVLRSEYINTNPLSPLSTISRGRHITTIINSTEAIDQLTLNAVARKTAEQASQIYEVITFDTGIMPMHASGDVIKFVHSKLNVSALYQETGWSYELKSGAVMNHTARRIMPI
jgi:hypothetical protein